MQEFKQLVLSLYDEQLRLKEPRKGEKTISWNTAQTKLEQL